MKISLAFLLLLLPASSFAQSHPKTPTAKQCRETVNTAFVMAADYSEKEFATEMLKRLSGLEDKLTACANGHDRDAKLLYDIFDAELRISAAKQVWLAAANLRRIIPK